MPEKNYEEGQRMIWTRDGLLPCVIRTVHADSTYDIMLEYTHLGSPVIKHNIPAGELRPVD